MAIQSYLPSLKLVSIVLSLGLSMGLVYAADKITHRPPPQVSVTSDAGPAVNPDWQASLNAIQAQNPSSNFAEPDPNFVNTLLSAAQSNNVTETIGKTILVNLSSAKSQGLGGDIPTQEQIIAQAAAQLKAQQNSPTNYKTSDLHIVPASATTLRAYGNEVMKTFSNYSTASERSTLLAIDYIVEMGDKSQVAKLVAIGAEYKSVAKALAELSVPQTIAPLHLALVNNMLHISATYSDMQTIGTDPLRGLVGLQTYQSLLDEGAGVFTNIAQSLNRGGILFNKDEPGSAWSLFLSSTVSP